jgi:hypothetical protein
VKSNDSDHAICAALDQLPYDIFISHAGPMKPFAELLEAALRDLGFKAFLDMHGLRPGDSADCKLIEYARTARIGLVLFCNDFLKREWPLKELKLIVEADTLLPVIIGMSHTDFKAAWKSSQKTPQFEEAFFEKVTRTTSIVDDGSWPLSLLQKICFAVLRVFVEKTCARLPNKPQSMLHIQRALEASRRVGTREFSKLCGREFEEAAEWVKHLKNVEEGIVKFNSPFRRNSTVGFSTRQAASFL